MNILVTGSSGFIARFLILNLASRGHTIIGLDKREGTVDFGDYFTFIHGNILDEEIVKKAMPGVDMVTHLAAEHQDFGVPEKLYYEVNVKGTEILLKQAGENGIKDFVFYSSVAVYGDNQDPSHESLDPDPVSPYGKSKLMAEKAIEKWHKQDKERKVLIIRPAVIFGPYNYANMYKLISSIDKKRYINVGDGKNIKSVGYVENIADATLFLMDRLKPGIEVYNYADSPHLESCVIASLIAKALNVKLPRVKIPVVVALSLMYPFDLIATATNINLPITSYRINKFTTSTHHLADRIAKLGFIPRFTIEEGLKKMVAWYASSEMASHRKI